MGKAAGKLPKFSIMHSLFHVFSPTIIYITVFLLLRTTNTTSFVLSFANEFKELWGESSLRGEKPQEFVCHDNGDSQHVCSKTDLSAYSANTFSEN